MNEGISAALAIVGDVLAAAGIPPKTKRPPRLAAEVDARGKVLAPGGVATEKTRKVARETMGPHRAVLAGAGIGSDTELLSIFDAALVRLAADGTKSITVSAWIGAVLEVEGPKHPYVKKHADLLAMHSIIFANDAIKEGRPAFIDGTGRIRTLPKRLSRSRMTEIHDLRVDGNKYCDRAWQITDAEGNMFIVLTQEFKTAGNKRSALDEQQNLRNVRIVDDKRTAAAKLTYFENGKPKEISLANVVVHLENTEAQLGVKAGRRNAWTPRIQKAVRGEYHATYHYLRIRWPSRELRWILQNVWNEL